jgi:hypothetical protein
MYMKGINIARKEYRDVNKVNQKQSKAGCATRSLHGVVILVGPKSYVTKSRDKLKVCCWLVKKTRAS